LASPPKKKNNHFVPRSYLRRFCSQTDRQIGLYNIKSGRVVEAAPIKSQCSRDYFYTTNPIFEEQFGKIESAQDRLLSNLISLQMVPGHETSDRSLLSHVVIFQAGRTAATVEDADHLTNQFGKALLHHSLQRDGKTDLLEILPKVVISDPNALMQAVNQHLLMYPLIDDLDVTLFLNDTSEDFLTSDHPVVLCNNLPASHAVAPTIGFASRGLGIVYPVSPRALLFFSDREVYKVEKNASGASTLKRARDVVEFNLAQCGRAFENVYFASLPRVEATLEAFRKDSDAVRPPRPALREIPMRTEDNRSGILLDSPRHVPRLSTPRAVQLRRAAKTGKYKIGNGLVRDPMRAKIVEAELRHWEKIREEALRKGEEGSIL
jgi:hypothetical protein